MLDTSNLLMIIYNNIKIWIEEKGVWRWDGMLIKIRPPFSLFINVNV
jgi:hypothetical protein